VFEGTQAAYLPLYGAELCQCPPHRDIIEKLKHKEVRRHWYYNWLGRCTRLRTSSTVHYKCKLPCDGVAPPLADDALHVVAEPVAEQMAPNVDDESGSDGESDMSDDEAY